MNEKSSQNQLSLLSHEKKHPSEPYMYNILIDLT